MEKELSPHIAKGKKLISLVLALLMVVMVFAACTGTPKDPDSTDGTGTKAPSDVTTAPETTADYVNEVLPKTNFNGDSYNLIAGASANIKPEDAENGEPVNDSLLRRNKKVADRYNVAINYTVTEWGGETREKIEQAAASGDAVYDVAFGNFQTVGTYLANLGLLMSADNFPHIDVTQEWWSEDCNDQLRIHNKSLFLTGYIAYDYTSDGSCVYFNKNISSDKGFDNHYSVVRDNKWTIDRMFSNAKEASHDDDGDTVMTSADTFGIAMEQAMAYGFVYGTGVRLLAWDANGTPYYNDDALDSNLTKMDKLRDTLTNQEIVAITNADQWFPERTYKEQDTTAAFVAGKALYAIAKVSDGAVNFRPAGFDDYGIVPFPKWDETQKDYSSWAYTWSGGGIFFPTTNHNEELTGLVTEALAYESGIGDGYYDSILEKLIKGKGTYDQDSEDMVDLVLSTKYFDLSLLYSSRIADFADYHVIDIWFLEAEDGTWPASNGRQFATEYASMIDKCKDELANIITAWDQAK